MVWLNQSIIILNESYNLDTPYQLSFLYATCISIHIPAQYVLARRTIRLEIGSLNTAPLANKFQIEDQARLVSFYLGSNQLQSD